VRITAKPVARRIRELDSGTLAKKSSAETPTRNVPLPVI
jgi:hypothetical protein